MFSRLAALCTVLIAVLATAAVAQSAPNITSLSPSVGPVPPAGGPVTIQGANFGTQPGAVTFGGTTVTPTSWSDKSIIVALPVTLPVGSLDVVVTVNGLASNTQSFLLIPTIIQDSPAQATVGTPIKISGTSFGDQQGSSTVTFNGTVAAPTAWSNTSITAPVPVGASDGAMMVTVNGFQTNGVSFPIVPNVTALTPNSGAVGTSVTITGTGFGASPGFGGVTFNGVSATITSGAWSDGTILVAVPSGATTGNVVVTAGNSLSSSGRPFTLPPTLVSLALSPSNPSIPLNIPQPLHFIATGSYSDGSSNDLTASVTWNTSNSSIASVLPIRGAVAIFAAGTATITATVSSVSTSTLVIVTPPTTPVVPAITGVSPSSGPAGTLVTITGSNFGAQQGSVWLGTTLGTVVGWSDQQVTATVNTGSASGTARIRQGGTWSNEVAFTVTTPTVLTVNPSSGLPGTQVTITGSGFGTVQSGGQVWLGTVPGSVTSWGDAQIIATVSPGSTSGSAQVLQNGVLSNATAFTVNIPQITNVSPNSGPAGTSVTIMGSGFGETQGANGVVWIGSAQGNVVNWSDAQVQATVNPTAVSGIVRIEQNGIWSNAVSFTVPPSAGSSVTLIPNLLTMVVGDSRSIQALDSTGKPVTGLKWTSSDITLATLSTDDPPIITAVAPGHVTITAGNGSLDLTIFTGPTLPLGTVQWSNPGDGSGVTGVLSAVPSGSGLADVFAFQRSGNVQAIMADGTVAWTATLDNTVSGLLPDFQGGLVAVDLPTGSGHTIKRFDGISGQPSPTYNFQNPPTSGSSETRPTRVFVDGTILTVDGDKVVGVNPQTMLPKFTISLDDSTTSYQSNCGVNSATSSPPAIQSFIIAGDGNAYIVYQNTLSNETDSYPNCVGGSPDMYIRSEEHTKVLRVGSGGDSSTTSVNDWAGDLQENFQTEIFYQARSGFQATSTSLITNADQGVVLPLQLHNYAYCMSMNGPCFSDTTNFSLAQISANGVSQVSVNIPSQATAITPVLQAADGSFIGTVGIGANPGLVTQNMIGFDLSGKVKWSVPDYTPLMATADGGVIAQSPVGTPVSFDSNGNATGTKPNAGVVYSRRANSYKSDGTNLTYVAIPPDQLAAAYAAIIRGFGSAATKEFDPPEAGLFALARTDLKNASSQCDSVLVQLAKLANVSEDTLVTQIHASAEASRNYIYDGPSSQTLLDAMKFPGAASLGVNTVSQWFGADNAREGLSQFNGSAVFLRLGYWESWLNGLNSQYIITFSSTQSGRVNYYGMGTLMHETLHKQAVGGGFTHGDNGPRDMDIAIGIVGWPTRTLGHNQESDALGKMCFGSLN